MTEVAFVRAEDYQIIVGVPVDGTPELLHQAGSNAVADRVMARLAAEIDQQLTPASNPDRRHVIQAPRPGARVMPCAGCGRMLHDAEMVWLPAPGEKVGGGASLRGRSGIRIPRVGCTDCARDRR